MQMELEILVVLDRTLSMLLQRDVLDLCNSLLLSLGMVLEELAEEFERLGALNAKAWADADILNLPTDLHDSEAVIPSRGD